MPFATRRTAALTLAGLAIATTVGVAGCGSDDTKPESRQVTVVGNGKVQGTPDTLNVTASIEATAPDVTAAMNQTSSRQQAVIDALSGAGIDKKDIATKQVELQPDYRDSAIVGYRASNTIDIKVRKLDTASQVLAKIVTAGGRVLCVTAFGENFKAAQKRAYEILAGIRFDGMQYRKDIGWRAIDRK